MPTYIALLRGINVSGQKKIKMADLRQQLAELSYQNIQTYIQSGNIIFETKKTKLAILEQQIQDKIKEHYGWEVPTLVLEPATVKYVLHHNPMLPDKEPDRIYITFLAAAPDPVHVAKINPSDYSPEEFILDGQIIFFFSPHGYGNAKMNNNFFEQKLKVKATTRNWKTVNKLHELTQTAS